MDNKELYLSSLDMSLSLCTTIYQMADHAKTNKRKCQQVAQRVKGLEGLLFTIKKKEQGRISETVENVLKELCSTLTSAKTLMEKVSQYNSLSTLTKPKIDVDKFSNVDERLVDNFRALSGFFLIDQGKNPGTMSPMGPSAQMTQANAMPPMMYGPSAQMTQPNAMPPMMYGPSDQMTQPNAMPPMMYGPSAQMTQPNAMPPMMYGPSAQMTQPNAMPPMMYGPSAQMTQPNAMPPMMYGPSAQMTQPNAMPPMMYDPSAQMPQPNAMPPMMYGPSAQMPQPSTMPYMTMYNPATPFPSQSTMPTLTMPYPTTPSPFSSVMPSMGMSNSISPLSSIPFSTLTDHNSDVGMMAPMNVSRQTTPAVPNYGFSLR
ncbi:proline-rich extensin-like protein EPR1 [Cyclopterus lumpus]|uniref:proline-rich extensin-like protein EPR1 n=1 Tax=Cyclopterus lumpus TaxID=8103 RepID=UPI0014872F48|nr:proline-rich extensin-like protein EPR1 [Cyclopterus lumpus]